jgi:hypothetical protein
LRLGLKHCDNKFTTFWPGKRESLFEVFETLGQSRVLTPLPGISMLSFAVLKQELITAWNMHGIAMELRVGRQLQFLLDLSQWALLQPHLLCESVALCFCLLLTVCLRAAILSLSHHHP